MNPRATTARRDDVLEMLRSEETQPDRAPVGPLQAIASRPLALALPVLVLLVTSVTLALLRTPLYTSQARVVIGNFSFSSQAVPGYVLAAQDLAGTYARLASEGAVVLETAHRLGVPASRVQGAVSASPIVGSSVIIVSASDHNKQMATRIAGTAATVLTQITQSYGGASDDLLKQYVQANVAEQQAQRAMSAAQAAYESSHATYGSGSAQARAAFTRMLQARANFQAAQLRANSLGSSYQQAQNNDANSGGAVQLVSPAVPVGSDRRSKLELAVVAPVLMGSVIGTALATFLANRRRRVRA